MNDGEDDLDDLECLDLNEIIEEKNKLQNINKENSKAKKSNSDKENDDTLNIEEDNTILLQLTKSINKDIKNYLKESEEANLILTNNFTLNKNTNNINNSNEKSKEKESITDLLKSTLKKSKSIKSQNSESLYDTLKIDEINKEMQETNKLQTNSYTSQNSKIHIHLKIVVQLYQI